MKSVTSYRTRVASYLSTFHPFYTSIVTTGWSPSGSILTIPARKTRHSSVGETKHAARGKGNQNSINKCIEINAMQCVSRLYASLESLANLLDQSRLHLFRKLFEWPCFLLASLFSSPPPFVTRVPKGSHQKGHKVRMCMSGTQTIPSEVCNGLWRPTYTSLPLPSPHVVSFTGVSHLYIQQSVQRLLATRKHKGSDPSLLHKSINALLLCFTPFRLHFSS